MTEERNTSNTGKKKNTWWFIGSAGLFLVGKLKLLLPLLKLGSAGGTLLSMVVSIWAFALVAPIETAVGLIIMIFIHEMGHVIAARQKGLPTSAPIFIPFLGAMINMKRNPRDAETEAYVAMGGPLLGTIGASAAFLIGWHWELPLFIYLSWIGFFLNLFNLLPIHPLDGGRIAVAVSRWLWVLGLTGGLAVILYLHSYIMLFIWALFAFDLYKKYVRRPKSKLRTTWGIFDVELKQIEQRGVFIPGSEHRRELAYQTFSELEDGQMRLRVLWEEMGLSGMMKLPEQALIQKVFTSKIERGTKENIAYLRIHCQVEYIPHENKAYYEVAPKVRWRFGLAYGALVVFLIYMMFKASKMEAYL